MVSADFLDLDLHLHQWVGCGGDSDHQPVFLQILSNNPKLRSPFKFNAHWLLNEDFVDLLKASWIVYVDNILVSVVSHFVANLKIIKDVSISWSVKQKVQETKELVEIEGLIVDSFNKPGFGFSTEADRISLVDLESCRRIILLVCEQEARQKSRDTCLLCGDDNTSIFHKFANH